MLFRLFWLISLLGPTTLLAEQQIYPFSPSYSKTPQSNFERQHYYWRPLNQEDEYRVIPGNNWQAPVEQETLGVRDESDSSFSNWSHWQIPQTQGAIPYGRGFRFRPLNEREQDRHQRRNSSDQSIQFRPSNSATDRAFGFSMENQYRFRPDSRLERGSRSAPRRYSLEPPLHMLYPTP
ncbi:MAG: hypothetical protein ABW124_00360 [Candidatus Thiodiazotropha sp. 6PLUC9]